ncbi:hypothetical protein HMPREF0494_1753 [Limosilactobacillus antri DSM 16041]|uniref:Uncharacterized protein n=1 Tax=Limosilactobacillus antri DSM 16041 TaxID=525309 RepID=C8P8V9_9LACO|nr:hypothetical protein HMPREF0494_1753 [Limosilactobacillus antri DSM 16041]
MLIHVRHSFVKKCLSSNYTGIGSKCEQFRGGRKLLYNSGEEK